MKRLELDLGQHSYPILVGTNCMAELPLTLGALNISGKLGIISSEDIFALHGDTLVKSLTESGYSVDTFLIEAGEASKSLATVERLYGELLSAKFDRSNTLVALGGGVVGDITGFVAATLFRGINFVQVPTTLLAMVDSSVGGKTGVNHPLGKNLIGAFHQPKAVFIDVSTLQTLPRREVVSGAAELIKTGAIADRELFEEISISLPKILDRSCDELLIDMIIRSCSIKADIVAADERESGHRRILNFGHTIGHALESAAGMGTVRHGEAVAIGMLGAGLISCETAGLPEGDFQTLEKAISLLPLPQLDNMSPADVYEYVQRDKKIAAGDLHFILLSEIGQSVVSTAIGANVLQRTIAELLRRYA
ncbi:3-dehydroquinate synthase [Candidatus Neomarinimicrobiota bacterium]